LPCAAMLLTITSSTPPATDLGYLLHKHPEGVRAVDLAFGSATVFFPEASEGRCTAALLVEVDPIGLVRRGRGARAFGLAEYVNDRPYAASSFLSVAISKAFGTAMSGRSNERQELADTPISLEAHLPVVPARGGDWLAAHPERELITRRYLRHRARLTREALARLLDDDQPDVAEPEADREEQDVESPISLREQRLGSVLAALRASGARRVLD